MPVRSRALGLALSLLLALAACGGGDGGGGGGDAGGSGPTGGEGPGTTGSGPSPDPGPGRVGRIRDVLSSLATIDGRRTAGGDGIGAGALLATDTTGVLTFALDRKLSDCQLQPGSEVRVLPVPDRLLDFQRGTTICSTTPGGRENIALGAGNARVEARDPVFTVAVEGRQVVVRVSHGFVQVRSGPSQARVVGPNGQLMVSEGRALPRAAAYERGRLDPRERQAFGRMEAALPKPDFGLPQPGGSPALTRIRRERTLTIGVDDTADGGSEAFVAAFGGFMGEQWKVGSETPSLSRAQAGRALASGEVDVVVSSRSVPGARAIPFFDTPSGQTWSLFVSGNDGRFETTVRDFLVNALNFGQYGERYLGAFDRMPDYDAVRPLLFP